MNVHELQLTLSEGLSSGKLGRPVSFRLHVLLPGKSGDCDGPDYLGFRAAVAGAMQAAALAEQVLQAEPVCLLARGDAAGRLLHVLVTYAGGLTALLTIACTDDLSSGMHLLVIGNHGVLRLEGAECFEPESSMPANDIGVWQAAIESSLRQEASVPLV